MDAFIGEIRMFAGVKCPENWHFCDGTKLQIQQNQVLFSLLGTVYGGDGVSTFALPDLRGRTPIGQAPNATTTISKRSLGQTGGNEAVAPTAAQLGAHTHSVSVTSNDATEISPGTNSTMTLGTFASNAIFYNNPDPNNNNGWGQFSASAVSVAGGGMPHENRMSSFAINWIICLEGGLYPQSN